MLPNFLIIGAQKAGTSSLYRYLQGHPQVFVPDLKEPDFFVEERNWSRGIAWYEALFEGAGDAVAIGEASTSYTMYPMYDGVPARIADLIPRARLVYLVRDPVERMRSDYLHYRNLRPGAQRRLRIEREMEPLERALISNPHYLHTSRYALQIEQYLAHFPRDRLLVITSEDLRHRRLETLRRVFEFVGVDPHRMPSTVDQEFNVTDQARLPTAWSRALRRAPGYVALAPRVPAAARRVAKRLVTTEVSREGAEMPAALRERLREQLRDDVKRLRPYLGDGFDGWGIA